MTTDSAFAVARKQQTFFQSGATRSLDFRKENLQKLQAGLRKHEKELVAALRADLGKSEGEAVLGELLLIHEELRFALKHLRSWAKPERVSTPLVSWPARSLVLAEPRGVILIIGPWNYPLQLLLAPLIGAIAAGNCAVLKPSELAPQTSQTVAKLITDTFPPAFVTTITGGVETSQALLAERWDYIFFTGGTEIGRIVMTAAAKYLTPLTLELGGKSPCILSDSADLEVALRRIVWGKFFNSGQTCVAPDYLLVSRPLLPEVLRRIPGQLESFFGSAVEKAEDYGRIISDRHFDRLIRLMSGGKVALGGQSDKSQRFLAPTLLTDVDLESPLMKEEIFGPLLPLIPYDHLDEAIGFVRARPKPLALYLFSRSAQDQQRVLEEISFGGGAINDTLIHLGNPRLPFGGVGDSGVGHYHGKFSFDIFSHHKSVVKRPFWGDFSLRYPPYRGKLKWLKRILGV